MSRSDAVVPAKEAGPPLESLRNTVATRQVHPFPYVKVGTRVRIRSGPLAGLEGIVVRTSASLSVVLTVELEKAVVATKAHTRTRDCLLRSCREEF